MKAARAWPLRRWADPRHKPAEGPHSLPQMRKRDEAAVPHLPAAPQRPQARARFQLTAAMATANEGAAPPSASLPPPRLPPSMARPPTPRSTPSAPLRATPPPITGASSPHPSPVPRRPALEPTSTLHPPASTPAPEPLICSQDPARGLDEGKEASQHAASLSIYKVDFVPVGNC